MTKNVGLTYVKDFSFPAEQGFSGSAGVHKVRGYMRGGSVKKAHQKMPANVKARGGRIATTESEAKGMGLHKSAGRRAPGTTRSAKGGSIHDKLKSEGAKMGYAYGGQVKNTSSEFKAKRAKQATMDHGVQPAQKGRNQQEVEAGGNKRLKPGYKKGGGVCRVRMPKNVKAKGGLAKYAGGGPVKKAAAAQ